MLKLKTVELDSNYTQKGYQVIHVADKNNGTKVFFSEIVDDKRTFQNKNCNFQEPLSEHFLIHTLCGKAHPTLTMQYTSIQCVGRRKINTI